MGEKIKIIKTRFAPRRYCVNLFNTIWTRDDSWIRPRVINHEQIHTAQQHELLWIPFYILYLLEWLFRLIQYRNPEKAYRNISFEREAYANDANPAYLRSRPRNAWRRYLRN